MGCDAPKSDTRSVLLGAHNVLESHGFLISIYLGSQLCRGASSEERKKFLLPDDLEHFQYLAASGCSQIAGTDDAADFAHVKHSMSVIGIDQPSQVQRLLQLLFSGGSPMHLMRQPRAGAFKDCTLETDANV